MKLHLPTRLRAAVLACITAVAALATTVGTGALTTGVVAYTIAASQARADLTGTTMTNTVTLSDSSITLTGSVAVTAGNTGSDTPIGETVALPAGSDCVVFTSGRYKVNDLSSPTLAGVGALIVAGGTYGAESTAYTAGQLMVGMWNRPDGDLLIENEIYIGASSYSEGNYSGALRVSDTTANKKIVFAGAMHVVQDTTWAVGGTFNYVDGHISGAGKTITTNIGGTLNFGGGAELGGLVLNGGAVQLNATKYDGSESDDAVYSIGNKSGTGVLSVNAGATLNLTGGTLNTVTMNGGSLTMTEGATAAATVTALTLSADATVNNTSSQTMTLGGLTGAHTLTNAAGSSLTLGGTMVLHNAIVNNGTILLGDNLKFDLEHLTKSEQGVYTLISGTAVDLTSLTADNLLHVQEGYSYTFGADGTVTAAAAGQNRTWSGGHLDLYPGASVDGGATFANQDFLTFRTADADVTLTDDVNSSLLTVDAGVTVSMGGAHTLTVPVVHVNGTLELTDSTLTAPELNVAGELILHSTGNLGNGTKVVQEGTVAKVTIAGVVDNGDRFTGYAGTLHVADGGTLTLTNANLGATGKQIIVDAGGVLNLNGLPVLNYVYTLNGGALVNNGADINTGKQQTSGIILTADSEIGGTGRHALLGSQWGPTSATLNGNKLTKVGANTVDFISTTVGGGVLCVKEGVLNLSIDGHGSATTLACDVEMVGGELKTESATTAAVLRGQRTITGLGGGVISAALTSSSAVTVDVADGASLSVTGAMTVQGFAKTGAGALTMANLTVTGGVLQMQYDGALTLTEVSVAAGTTLQYGAGSSLLNLTEQQVQGALALDILDVDASTLSAGLNLGIASGVSKDNISVLGMAAESYTLAEREGNWYLTTTASPVVSTDWDSHWSAHELVKAPTAIKTADITASMGLADEGSVYDDGTKTAVILSGEGGAAVKVFGGVNNEATGSSVGSVTRDTWIKATSGTYQLIAGGNQCNNWSAAPVINLDGSTHVLVDGATVGFVMGGNYRDGQSAQVSGDTYVTVQGNSAVSSVYGAGTTAHNRVNQVGGSTHVYIYTPLAAKGDIALENIIQNVVAGGGTDEANNRDGAIRVMGDTNVTIDLSAYEGTTTFAKHVVGASYICKGTGEVVGDTNLTITAADTVTFNSRVTAGVICDKRNEVIQVTQKIDGTATAVINGGKYTAYSGAAGYLNTSADVSVGAVHLTVNGGTFTERYAGGVFQNTNQTTTVLIGNIVNELKGGSFSNGNFAFVGGNVIYSQGTTACSSTVGNITTTLDGASVTGKVYGGSFNHTSHTAGTFTHGDIAVNLLSGSLNGDVFAGGTGCAGNATMTAASTTVTIGKDIVLTSGKTISGGYEFNTGSTVNGSRTLAFSTDGAQDVTATNFKDFDVVNVSDAAGVVSIGSIVSTTGAAPLTKTGAGVMKLAASFEASSLVVNEGSLNIAEATDLKGSLTLGAGGTLQTTKADAAMAVTGLTVISGTTIAIADAAEGYTSPIKLLSGLTEAAISGLTFTEEEGSKYADISGIITVTGVSSDYNRLLFSDGTLSLVSAAAPVVDLVWNAGSGTWGGGDDHWTSEGEATEYVPGANVTISGTEGGMIALSSPQKAKSVTIAHSGYTLANESMADTLTITGDFTVKENVSTTLLNFVPDVGGNIVVKSGATLDMSAIDMSQNLLVTVGSKATGDGTVILKGNSGTDLRESVTFNTNVKVDGGLWLNGRDTNATVTVTEGNTLTLTGELSISRAAKVAVDGGTLDAQGGISIGHPDGNYPTTLSMSSGEIKTTGIKLQSNNTNTIEITGGKLTVTNADAFTGTNDKTTVNISDATLTNGTTDMAFNHASTLTNATVTAQEGTTITVGGTGLTTNVATGLTTNGTVTMAGTTAVAGAATVTDNGTLTIASLAGAEGSNVTLAGTGTTTITGGTADTLTAGKDATVGDLTVKTLTGTGTLTQTTGTTLTMADGGTLSGSVTTGAITAAGSLAKTGTGTVATGDITGTSTALTVSGGTLSAGAVTVASAEVATGATLTSSGKLTSTGALTLNGAATADSADIASVILNAGGSLTCTNDLKLGGLTLNTAITSAGVTAASLSSEALNITASADVLGALAMGAGDTLTIVGLTTQYANGLTLNGSTDATLDAFGYKYTVAATADGIVIQKADAGVVWTGGADDEWGKEGSWQGGGIPTGDDVSASFTGKGDGTVKVSTDGVTIGQVIVTSHDAASGTKSEYTFTNGDLTITDDLKVLDGHVVIGTTVAAADVTIIPSSDTAVSSVTVNGDGALSVTGTLAVESATDTTAGSLTIQEGGFAGVHTLASSTADVALGGTLAVEEGVIKKLTEENGTKGNLVVGSMVATMSLTPVVPDEVIILEDSTIDTLLVTGTGNLTTKGNLTAETSTDVAGTVTAEKNLTTGAMTVTSTGDVTVGSETAPATLDVATLENAGTVTVYNTMTASTSVDNTGTLDIKGELQASEAAVENSSSLTVGGVLAASSLTTNSGATTEAQGGAAITDALTNEGTTTVTGDLAAETAAVQNNVGTLTVTGSTAADTLATAAGATTDLKDTTIGTSLENHGTTTITGNLASADTTGTNPGSAAIVNDATGMDEKLVVTGDVSGASLTTETGATTEIGGAAKLAGNLTNDGTTTVTGAATVGGDVLNTGDLSTGALGATGAIANSGTLNAEGNITAASLNSEGTTTAAGNVTLDSLSIADTGSLTAGGTVKTKAVESTGGSLTADALDLSGLTAAATIAAVKADKITLNGFEMLTVTDNLANEAGTGAAQVTLLLDDADMSVLSIGDEKIIIDGDGAVSGKGFTLANLGAVNDLLEAYGLKGAMVTNAAGQLVMQMQDNSFETQIGLTENGKVGAAMMDEASAAGLAVPGSALADVYAALDACRDSGNAAAGDKLAAALTGSSIAAMGSALSGDVERQLKAIRNRTTTMGVNQCVVNEGMPYFNAWVNAEGDYRKVAADGTLAGYKLMSWGGTVGVDIDCTPSFTCGLAATAMYGDFDAESEDSASGDIDTYYVSAFARYAKHRWTHTFVATVGLADTSLERTVLGHKVKGDSNGMMFGGLYEVGYVFALDKEATTCLQPIFNVSFTHASLSGYDEEGANIGLTAGDVELNKITVGLGARLQSVVGEDIYNRSSILEARALVKVDAGDRQGESNVAFAGTGLPKRTAKSSETGVVGAEVGIGLTVPVGGEGGNLFLDASAEIRAEYTNVNATVGYRINF